jgi:predicted transcriptional regulator
MEKIKVLTTLDEVKAISDPLKYRILMSYIKKDEPATVKQIADAINEVPAKVHYHVKKMESLGILELIYTKEIKGIIAKYYQPTAEKFEIKCESDIMNSNKQLVIAEKQRLVGEIYDTSKNEFFEQVNRNANKSEKIKGHFGISELYLDDNEMKEFEELLNEFMTTHCNKLDKKENKDTYHCFIALFETK